MITIDGREGGGQLIRTALSLSVVTQTPFEVEDIRGARPQPGLKPQHLAAVRAVAALCEAEVSEVSRGSSELTFRPGPIQPASLDVEIGTAGSITLLFDAILPLATRIHSAIELTVGGGTDVKWSPSFGYLQRVKLPLLGRFGFVGSTTLDRTGFYPAGGGRATLTVEPSNLHVLHLDERGPLARVDVHSKATTGLADSEVAERQARTVKTLLREQDIAIGATSIEYVEADSNGSVLLLRSEYADTVAGFDALGERGKPAEAVAGEAVDQFFEFHRGDAAVDSHMGDQLLVFLALAGGRVRTPELTDHMLSNAALIETFGFDLQLDRQPEGTVIAAT